MNLTPQHQRILALHADKEWHCSTEIEFIRDQRKRISELNHGGYAFESMKCNICAPHKHNSSLLMRRLIDTHYSATPIEKPVAPRRFTTLNGQTYEIIKGELVAV